MFQVPISIDVHIFAPKKKAFGWVQHADGIGKTITKCYLKLYSKGRVHLYLFEILLLDKNLN